MYSVIKSIIDSGSYNLNDILNKIDIMWVKSSLTDDERDELIQLARDNANPIQSTDISDKLIDHDKRITVLEQQVKTLLESSETEPEPTPVEYPEYVEGKWYYKDDTITFNGKKYICIAPEGQVCTWSPAGYPSYWQLVE